MKKKNGVIILTISMILTMGFVTEPFAQEAKKYPPYPDVWGYRLSIAEGISPGFRVGRMADGDYIVSYDKEKKKDGFYRTLWVTFFGGVNKEFEKDEWGKFWKKMGEEKREVEFSRWPKITLSDGTTIERYGGPASGRCDDPFDAYFKTKDKNSNDIIRKMFFYLYDKPVKDHLNPYCERNMHYNKDYYFKKVENIFVVHFLPLEDDTFLMLFEVPKSLLFIRFDSNFNTKRSDLFGKDIFGVDRKTFVDIRNKLKDGNDQEVNNTLSAYLKKIREEGKR